jgi:hypothetical protein
LFFDNDFFNALFCRAKRFHNRRAAGAVDFLQHSEFIIYKQKLLEFVGPAARLSVYSV